HFSLAQPVAVIIPVPPSGNAVTAVCGFFKPVSPSLIEEFPVAESQVGIAQVGGTIHHPQHLSPGVENCLGLPGAGRAQVIANLSVEPAVRLVEILDAVLDADQAPCRIVEIAVAERLATMEIHDLGLI